VTKRLDYQDVKNYIESFNYKLISEIYKSCEHKLLIECDKGHQYLGNLHNFKLGNRCPFCNTTQNTKHNFNFIKEKIGLEGYKLLSTEYINSRQKLELICTSGHNCSISFHDFQKGCRCKTCFNLNRGKNRKLTYEVVKKDFEDNGYTLLTDLYENIYQKLDVICPNGHSWSVSVANFRNNNCRCSKCPTNTSKAELEIFEYLKQYFCDIVSGDRSIIAPLELDIVIPSKKVAIEYCGLYWHSDLVRKDENYHLNKLKKCNEVGYRLITIFEDEWNSKKEVVKSTLDNILNIKYNKKLFGRKCSIKELSSSEAREFFDNNHLQGYSESSIKLGAFYNEKLVASMTFGKANISRNIKSEVGLFELNRFCTENGLNIIGIASKLLKYFIQNFKPMKIYTYLDRRWFEGNLYKVLGFTQTKINPPSYWYVKNNGYKKYHRFNFRKSVLHNKLENFDDILSEKDNMENNGYKRIWDCGTIKYELQL
jgi:hypothetical protein